jgi:CheY-like chemotaxis protein
MDKPTCFLIDDDEDDREIFALALENVNDTYNLITAKNGPEAISILTNNALLIPDYIFIDLNMPFMSGSDCLKKIKEVPRFASTPVIIYTTSSYSKDAEQTKQLGATHFLVKPPGISILTGVLKRIINKEELPYYLDEAAY